MLGGDGVNSLEPNGHLERPREQSRERHRQRADRIGVRLDGTA
jgi:hypothetical protein